jgi:hypothetical protein
MIDQVLLFRTVNQKLKFPSMKAITAGKDYWMLTYRVAKFLRERVAVLFKAGTFFQASATVKTGDMVSHLVPSGQDEVNSTDDYYNSQFIVLYGIHPPTDIAQVQEDLVDMKLTFGPYSKIIIYSDSYVDELVHRSDELNYDAYLLTCDRRDELKNAVRNLQVGKWYLSKSVITSYCISRRKDWAD